MPVPDGLGKAEEVESRAPSTGAYLKPCPMGADSLHEHAFIVRLTNTEVRAMLGVSRLEAARIMQRLRDEGRVRLVGQGRGAHWVPEKKK